MKQSALDQSENTLVVSMLQASAKTMSPEARIEELESALQAAAKMGADLLVCPELFLSGYVTAERSKQLAEPVDGPFANAVSALALRYGIAVAYGYPERDGQFIHNSMLVFGSDGEMLGNYQKTCFPPGFDASCFVAGTSDALFTIKGILCGCLICYDVEFPENTRRLAMKGAELIVVPTALLGKWNFVVETLVPTRAFENGISIAYANFAADNEDGYAGLSRCVDPIGQSIAVAGLQSEIITAHLTPEVRSRQKLPYLSLVERF